MPIWSRRTPIVANLDSSSLNQSPPPMHLAAAHSYRGDIDGLRAIAVGSVVAFHAFPESLPGGFVGVDIFFVISGYLITTILLREMAANRFRLGSFLERRIRRIFPALVLVLVFCVAAGYWLLSSKEFKTLNSYAIAGLLSAGNIKNLLGQGYFESASELTPLLHLWSLGVEEQFYLVWPWILLLAYGGAQRTRRLRWAVGTTIVLSFIANIVWLSRDASAAFYLPFTRFWELGLGGFLASFPGLAGATNKHIPARHALGAISLLLLVVAIAVIDEDASFPGWWALLPVLGAAGAIAAGPTSWVNRYLLASTPMIRIGLISYPLYLWHWPLLSFARIVTPGQVPLVALWGLLAASVALSWLTYRFLETPIRNAGKSSSSVRWLLASSAVLVLVCAAGRTRWFGPRERASTQFVTAQLQRDLEIRGALARKPCREIMEVGPWLRDNCMLMEGPPGAPWLVVWGDSHSTAWSPAFFEVGQKLGYGVVLIAYEGCAPLLGVRKTDRSAPAACKTFELGDQVLELIARLKPVHTYLIARWEIYENGWRVRGKLQRSTHYLTHAPTGQADLASSKLAVQSQFLPTVAALRALAPLTVFKGVPSLEFPAEEGLERDPAHFEPTLAEHRARYAISESQIDEASRRYSHLRVVDPALRLCKEGRCGYAASGLLVHFDDNHITAQAARLFTPLLSPLESRSDAEPRAVN